uniref:Sugar phosphate transporter domain-containing protein n=1 Tax=Zooxanthella nutricula TaxID=1333877 RepID=A0A7S2PZD4_9DINO
MCAFGVRRPTRSAIAFVFVIVAGTAMEVRGELKLSIIGVALMLTSEICEAVSLVLTQKLLQDCNLSVMEGMYLLSPPTVLSLGIISLWLEVPQMASSGDYVIIAQNPGDFLGASALGLVVNFTTMFLVQATSSLFAKILNTARCIGVVVIGVLFYGEVVGLLEGVGYAIALFGFAGYTFVQLFPEAGLRLEKAVDCCSGSSGASLDEQTGGKATMAAILKKPEADHGGKANQPSECFSTSEQRNAV